MIRSLFFDAAGTLIRLAQPVGVTYARIAASHGLAVDPSQLEQTFRAAWKELPPPQHPEGAPAPDDDRSWWQTLVRRTFDHLLDTPLEEPLFSTLFADLYEHFEQPAAWTLFDDATPALNALRPRFDLHLLSNFDRRLHTIIRGLGIADCFQTVTLSSLAGASKPDPRIFRHALHLAGTDAQQALHIGDESVADVLGATRAGLHAFQVHRPEHDLLFLTQKLLAGDFSCLQPPSNCVSNPPHIEARVAQW